MTKGDTIEMGNTALVTVLSTDSDSTVLQANYIDSVFLFMSDASYDTEVKLTEMYDVKSDVLLVSHNGNKDASYNDFIREVAPDYAVISPGTEIYSEEAKKTLEENTDYILTSNEYGRIVISSDGYQLNFSSDKE